jgi:hypothetical protein
MKEATGSATPCGCHSEKHMGFSNYRKQCRVLLVDEIVEFKGPVSQFPVNRAFRIIQCQISQLLLYLFIYLPLPLLIV